MITLTSSPTRETTTLSNYFIDNYMPGANGEFVKVYVYLLRQAESAAPALSLDQMADCLMCTEGDILRALKYWENEKLLLLSLQANGGLAGITLCEPWKTSASDIPSGKTAKKAPSTETPVDSSIKISLTPDRVKELKQNEEIVQLLYIAEQYLGKTLTPTDTQKLLFFYDGLSMSAELIDYLIEYCVGRGHKSMRYIETVAMAWASEGITTVAMAKDSTSRYGKDYFTILKFFGISNRNPVDTEVSIMDTWMKDYAFSLDLIHEACTRTILQTGQPSFQYADKILQKWLKEGVHSAEDIARLDKQHQKRRKSTAGNSASSGNTGGASNRFNNFQQRDYNFDEYEKKLLSE